MTAEANCARLFELARIAHKYQFRCDFLLLARDIHR
jgi:hypothetical protein